MFWGVEIGDQLVYRDLYNESNLDALYLCVEAESSEIYDPTGTITNKMKEILKDVEILDKLSKFHSILRHFRHV